jgi:hypothetical protein
VIWGCKVRRGAPWALGVGLALAAMAASGACAEVRSINLDECSGTCIASAIDDPAAAEDESASDITLSLIGGGATDDANDVRPALVLDGRAMPTVLVSGLPSPIALAGAQTPDDLDVSPYDFFADVIDVPHSADARAFAVASFFFFAPSLNSRPTLTNVLWASQAFFGPRSGDVASRLGVPLFADPAAAAWQPMRTQVMPAPSLSAVSGPPSGAPVWDEWSCMWTQPLSDPWKQPSQGPC